VPGDAQCLGDPFHERDKGRHDNDGLVSDGDDRAFAQSCGTFVRRDSGSVRTHGPFYSQGHMDDGPLFWFREGRPLQKRQNSRPNVKSGRFCESVPGTVSEQRIRRGRQGLPHDAVLLHT